MIKLSVIIPAYNSEQWITRCLDSVLAAIDNSCEVIVVDDGSEDLTAEVVNQYAAADSRVQLIESNHSGPGVARMIGYHHAVGQWLTFVDSDDTIPRDSLRKLRAEIADDVDIIAGNVSMRSPSGTRLADNGTSRSYTGEQFAVALLENQILNVMVGKLIRRSLFDRINLDIHSTATNHEDAMTIINLACAAQGLVVVIPAIIAYNYIMRSGSQSSMLHLTLEGVENVWDNVKELPLPKESLVRWGLGLIYQSFIERGIEFPNSYPPAVEIRKMARGLKLGDKHRPVVAMLYSKALRRYVMRRHAKNGILTNVSPHLAFIIVSHNNAKQVKRTVNSIFKTGFRNIEIIIIDDASNHRNAVILHELNVRFRRIKVFKNPTYTGNAKSRAAAHKSVTATCVMFLNPGDKIERQGVLEAVIKIDNGADIVAMATQNFSTITHARQHVETPAIDSAHDPADTMLTDALLNYATKQPLGGLILRTTAIEPDDFVHCKDPQQNSCGILMRMSLNMRCLKYAIITKTGYLHAQSPQQYTKRRQQWQQFADTAIQASQMLKESDMEEKLGDIANGLTRALTVSTSRITAQPWKNKHTIHNTIEQNLANKNIQKIYADAGQKIPDADTIIANARLLNKKYRTAYLRHMLLKH